jgi:hypothetical protein
LTGKPSDFEEVEQDMIYNIGIGIQDFEQIRKRVICVTI